MSNNIKIIKNLCLKVHSIVKIANNIKSPEE